MSADLRLHHEVESFRAACDEVRSAGGRLGLVPTMGALHEGHLALIDEAHRHADRVAVTIFVNPTQFVAGEDLGRYPRQLEQDLRHCVERQTALVFAPNAAAMYLEGEQTRVNVGKLTDPLCGRSRPGHFTGVATIVAKLFAIAGPCVAIFGKKDYQQLKVIERMTQDLCLPVEVVAHPIVRAADGLALSSRNVYLSSEERQRALSLARGLSRAAHAFADGVREVSALMQLVRAELDRAAAKIDYVELVDAEDLSSIGPLVESKRALLAVAAFIGQTRLIDNLVLGHDPAAIAAADLQAGGT